MGARSNTAVSRPASRDWSTTVGVLILDRGEAGRDGVLWPSVATVWTGAPTTPGNGRIMFLRDLGDIHGTSGATRIGGSAIGQSRVQLED